MPRALQTPSYRLHKPSGQAVVELSGRTCYLGRFGTPESQAEYDRIVAEWLTNGRRLPTLCVQSDLTVNELCLAFLKWADAYYRKNGQPTKEPENLRLAVRPLRQLYGHTLARDFGPLALKAVRGEMIASGLCRTEINRRVGKILRVFKWGASEELVSVTIHQALQTVPGLRRGRGEARESAPVKPVPEAFVDALRPVVSREVWAMIDLQRLSGMRPGEVVLMRTCDLDMSGRVWTYSPETHKTEHHGRKRTIYFGPRSQSILRHWLRSDLRSYIFSPAEATAERHLRQREGRKTPVQPSQRCRAKRNPSKSPGDRYTVESYRRAIAYGCLRAGVPKWHPNQLRHYAATRLRKEFGLDVARAVLGHSSPAVTEVYAELDQAKAMEAMSKVG